MEYIARFCKELKKDFTPRVQNPKKPVSFWSEKDILDNKIVDAFVIIFRTKGCSWALKSGCSMCGYFNDSMWKTVSSDDLLEQFNTAMNNYNEEKFVKIFTSGSFLDDSEIKSNVQTQIISKLADNADKISVESRPEYITSEKIAEIKKQVNSSIFEIGIGLETADDFVRQKAINKGFTFNDYKKAADILKKNGFSVKTYVLVKPPFLTEKEAINDSKKTVNKIKEYADIISFNPINVQRNTFIEYLWKKRLYRPPWLWSIVDILKESKKNAKNLYLKCNISGGGSIRGPHNCKNCDHEVLDAISSFSLNQNVNVFNELDCECKQKWLDQLELENLSFGSIIDMDG